MTNGVGSINFKTSVEVVDWGSKARGSGEDNDCIWNIAKNTLSSDASNAEIAELMNEIAELNDKQDTALKTGEEILIPIEASIQSANDEISATIEYYNIAADNYQKATADLGQINSKVVSAKNAYDEAQANGAENVDELYQTYLDALSEQKAKLDEVDAAKEDMEAKQAEIDGLKEAIEGLEEEYKNTAQDMEEVKTSIQSSIADIEAQIQEAKTKAQEAQKAETVKVAQQMQTENPEAEISAHDVGIVGAAAQGDEASPSNAQETKLSDSSIQYAQNYEYLNNLKTAYEKALSGESTEDAQALKEQIENITASLDAIQITDENLASNETFNNLSDEEKSEIISKGNAYIENLNIKGTYMELVEKQGSEVANNITQYNLNVISEVLALEQEFSQELTPTEKLALDENTLYLDQYAKSDEQINYILNNAIFVSSLADNPDQIDAVKETLYGALTGTKDMLGKIKTETENINSKYDEIPYETAMEYDTNATEFKTDKEQYGYIVSLYNEFMKENGVYDSNTGFFGNNSYNSLKSRAEKIINDWISKGATCDANSQEFKDVMSQLKAALQS